MKHYQIDWGRVAFWGLIVGLIGWALSTIVLEIRGSK